VIFSYIHHGVEIHTEVPFYVKISLAILTKRVGKGDVMWFLPYYEST
jgi:hypothetical protein